MGGERRQVLKKHGLLVKEGLTHLIAQCGKNNYRSFIYPPEGPDFPDELLLSVDRTGLPGATAEEMAHLLYSASHDDSKYAKRIFEMLEHQFLLNNELLFSREGLYIKNNYTIEDDQIVLSELEELREKKYFFEDGFFRDSEGVVTHFPYEILDFGFFTSREKLRGSKFMSALFSEEGVGKLSELIGRNFDRIFTQGVCSGDQFSENESKSVYLCMMSHTWTYSSLTIDFLADCPKSYMFGVASD